jgi:PKD repeat protein
MHPICYRLISILLVGLFFPVKKTNAQCPVADFTIASPVCAGSPLNITNNSTGATNFEWDFAPGYFSQNGTKLSDTTVGFNYPGDLSSEFQNDTVVSFVCGNSSGKLYRVIYANGPESPLTQIQDLGNFGGLLYQPMDVALYREDSTWFGIIVDYGNNSLIRFRLGNSLLNTPDSTIKLLDNSNSNLYSPWGIKIVKDDSGTIHGLASNFQAGTITHFNFGNSIRNSPTPSAQIPVTGATYVLDAYIAHDCGNWYAFIAGYNSSNIIRADFGNSLNNMPTFTTIISNGSPSDIAMVNDSSGWKLLYTNYSQNNMFRYDLGSDLSNITPVLLGIENFGGGNPKGITMIRKNANTYLNILYNGSQNLQMIRYTNPTVVNKYSDTTANPQNILFSGNGMYAVTLRAIDNAGNYSTKTVSFSVKAVPIPGFSFMNQCIGDTTFFTDSTTISSGSIVDWSWDFGDGNNSQDQNPFHTYSATGNKTVSLVTISDGGCSDTISQVIEIAPFPVASFTPPTVVCSQTELQFIDQSSVASGFINSWNWDFGNGDSSIAQNPLYSFPLGGNFTVTLTVTSSVGCNDSDSSLFFINDRPQAGFKANNTCIGQNVQFIDETIINNAVISNYSWDFGDASTDSTQHPSHLYPAVVSTYPVQLIVTAANGCIDTAQQQIKINNIPTVNFSYQPVTACQNNNISFADLSIVTGDTISGWTWDFGDGSNDSVMNPVHRFSNPGLHVVTLVAYSPSNCPGIATQQIIDVKESPDAMFTYSTTCIGNSTHFTNNSVPASGSAIDSVFWIFNATDTVSVYNPDYTFPATGDFTVLLTVLSPEGCSDTDSTMVRVHARPDASFTHATPCSGDSIQFTSTSTCDSLSSISQYEWNFGDLSSGAANYSALQNPKHKYTTIQAYTSALITTTDFGCKDTAFKTFSLFQSPVAQFTYSPTCYGDLMEFFNPGSVLDSIYSWNFGDNQTNQLKEPAHYYAFPGNYSVKLTVTAKTGCVTNGIKQVAVSPIPTANFNTTPACVNTEYIFEDNSSVASGSIVKWKWGIAGLASPDSVQYPVYTFTDSGTFNVTLTVTSDIGCSKSTTKALDVYELPVASFSFDPQYGNPPLLIQTTDLSTGGANNRWDFGDGSLVENDLAPSHVYNDTGLFLITQYVTSLYGCKDSVSKSIYVITPVIDVAITGDSSYFDGNYFHVVGRLENRGTREINSLQMEARLENGNTIREDLNVVIPNGPLGYYTYSFHASFLINQGSELTYYCIRADNPNGTDDSKPENNERCFNLTDDVITMDPFPNPFTDKIIVRMLLPKQDDLTIDLADMTGKVIKEIYTGKGTKNLFELEIDLSDIADGIYSLKIVYNDEVVSKNLVKNSY